MILAGSLDIQLFVNSEEVELFLPFGDNEVAFLDKIIYLVLRAPATQSINVSH